MKLLQFLAISFFFVVFLNANDEMLSEEILQECKNQEIATDEDVQTIGNHNIPETRGAKCLLACTMEKFDVVSKINSS